MRGYIGEMANSEDSLTLALQGDVSVADLAAALAGFRDLLDALSEGVDDARAVSWRVSDLEAGSAIATARGEVQRDEDRPKVVEVIRRYERAGRALESGEAFPFSERAKRSAHHILSVIEGGRVRSVRFETALEDHEVSAAGDAPAEGVSSPRAKTLQPVLGAVRGRIQSISNRAGLRFTIYDLVEDRPISCYLASGLEETMRDSWGKVAIVEGIVRRDVVTGRPTCVRNVSRVTLVQEGRPRGYRDAIGAAPASPGEMTPEEAVRKTRDG